MAKEETLKLDIEELRKLIDLSQKELERFNLTGRIELAFNRTSRCTLLNSTNS